MKTLVTLAILLTSLLLVGGALNAAETNSEKLSIANELPFRILAAQVDTPDGSKIKLTFSNVSDAPVIIDQEAFRKAVPSILVDLGLKDGSDTRVSKLFQKPIAISRHINREQIAKDKARAVTIKPNGKFEIFIPFADILTSTKDKFPGNTIKVKYIVPNLILDGKFNEMLSDDLFGLQLISNNVILK